ncbi:hypothetical protein QFC21_003972 [Naganishia friedmannii]|uniref:Uncharacterized protein n=1 Tax=Naganishia friedmannii TaxID=89922 RepID=A0ACC2VLG6_9TREE|nr:hypothetical protein QFC21_003972 [Naganishia friedmannii]
MSFAQGRYVARLFNTPSSRGGMHRGKRNGEDDNERARELGSLEIEGSLAETESIFRSPKASTLGTLLSVGRSDELLGSSGTLTETRALKLGERQALIEEQLAIATPASKKLKGLGALRNLIASAEKSTTRSRKAYAIEVIDAMPRLTDNGRELLLSACQMLQSLIGQEDRALIQSDKVEVWIAEAAALFGRGLAALFVTSPDHELSRPESLYLQVVQELLDCASSQSHAMNPTQLKLLIILSITGSFWTHGKHYAETYIEKIRTTSRQLLSRILRAYSARHSRAVKGIEILAVTSYDAALQGLLLQGNTSFRQQTRAIPIDFPLETMIVLWEKPPQTLKYKMNSVRSDRYYDVPCLWNAIEPLLKNRNNTKTTEHFLCDILPLMAFWDPESFIPYLDPTLRFLTESLPRVVALGKIVHALATEVLPMKARIFQYLFAAIEANLKSDAPFICAKMVLESLGPTATSEIAQVIASVERCPLRESSADFLTAIPLVIPSLTKAVNSYLLKEISRIEELNGSQLIVQRFLISSLQASAPTPVLLESLTQCLDARLCTEQTSTEIVNQILVLIAERQEPAILDASLQSLLHHHLRFDMKAVAHPLLLQLKRSDLQVQRIIAKLLTIQAIKFPSLIIPVLRNFMRSTLITLQKDQTKSQEWKLESIAILGIVLPALPPALSRMYSRPILDYLLRRLKACSTIGKGCTTCLETIGHLARSCSHVWDVEILSEALNQIQRLSSYASPKEAAGALACMASLMSIQESYTLQDGIMQYAFGHYLFSEITPEPSVKIGVMSLIGSVGTADRNALTSRGQYAGMKREEGIYDDDLRRRIATATVRDKRGVRSLDYKLSMISDNLVSALQRRGLPNKISVWHVVMKLALMLREEYVDKLPDVTRDIIEEIIEPSMSVSGRSYQPKLIALLSQSILLRNGTAYEDYMDRLLPVLHRIVADREVKPNTLWSVLLVNLSIISRRKKDLGPSALQLLPLIHETSMRATYLDRETLVFGLKLIAAFQSHCTMFVGNIGELLDHIAKSPFSSDAGLLIEVARSLAHLSEWTSLFEITASIEGILRLVDSHVSVEQTAQHNIEGVVVKLNGPSIYPDFRDYTDAQFVNLALQPQERAQAEFDASLWHFEDNIDYLEWQSWQSRAEYSILAACQVDVFFVACALWTDIPRGILHAAFVNLWDVLGDEQKFDAGNLNERSDPLVLWYTEIDAVEQFRAGKPIDFPKLIEANIRVGVGSNINQQDAASSSIDLALDMTGLMPKSDWLVALGKWDEALKATAREAQHGETDLFTNVANQLANEYYDQFSNSQKTKIAHWNTVASWAVGDFLKMAVLDIHHGEHSKALHHISKAKAAVYDELRVRTGYHDFSANNYTSAMKTLAKSEMLCELEEVIQYPRYNCSIATHGKQGMIGHPTKLKKAHPNVNSFFKRLLVQSLATKDAGELRDGWLYLAKLCQEEKVDAGKAILNILDANGDYQPHAKTEYTRMRFEWANIDRNDPAKIELLERLKQQTIDLSQARGTALQRRWLSRHLMRLSAWTKELQGDAWLEDETLEVYKYTRTAAMIDPGWYSCMDQLSTFALDTLDRKNLVHGDEVIPDDIMEVYILPACFEHSAERILKQTLQAIALWFRYGSNVKVVTAFRKYLKQSPHRAWLEVLPQLIARLGAKDHRLRHSLLEHLLGVAKSFPHAVIWPLLTAAETPRSIHQTAAREIMGKMRDDNMISKMVQESPQSEEEYLFVQKYGDSLMSAKFEVEKYLQGGKTSQGSYYKACGEYQALYRKIYGSLEEWRKASFQLNLHLVAPRLISIEDSNLIVPGQYDSSLPLVEQPFISRIDPTVEVINTKQLPRKLIMRSNKDKFVFLLKGNEDLRQDERVMQLITLTNLLLSHNSDAFSRQLFIQPYSAVPLGPNSGLLSWIPNTETIMQLISSSRSRVKGDRTSENERAVMVGLDAKTLRQSHVDFDKLMQQYSALPMEQKLRQYHAALAQSDNDDLKNLLWRRSSSSQTWLSRRTCFARSVATTSMIGYVIGLGDRHPGNTLIEQTKFNAISIDFGDVFEAAHERTPYPEKVPFRLTPQIYNAFEFAAIHGSGAPGSRGHFKSSSVLTMDIMRKHKASLLAMLEAFAYDPLLNWKAKEVEIQGKRRDEQPEQEASTDADRRTVGDKPVIRQEQLQAKLDKQLSRVRNLTISLGGSFIVAGSVLQPKVAETAKMAKITEEGNEELDIAKLVPSDIEDTRTDDTKSEPQGGSSIEDAHKKTNQTSSSARDGKQKAGQTSPGGSRNHGEGYFAKMANTMTNDRALKVLTVIERKLQGRHDCSHRLG